MGAAATSGWLSCRPRAPGGGKGGQVFAIGQSRADIDEIRRAAASHREYQRPCASPSSRTNSTLAFSHRFR